MTCLRRGSGGSGRVIACALLLWCGAVVEARAQLYLGRADVPRFGTMEVGGGGFWTGGWTIADRSADLTRNPGTGTGGFTLFDTESEVKAVAGARAHVAFYLSRRFAVEGGLRYSRPIVSTRVSGDAEGAADVTAEETMSRYVFTGSLVYHLTRASFAGGRGVPFLTGGAGYLRELHDGRELVETGTEYHAGAGVKFWFGTGRRRLGIRTDVGVSIRDGAFDGEEGRRTLPMAGASVQYLF